MVALKLIRRVSSSLFIWVWPKWVWCKQWSLKLIRWVWRKRWPLLLLALVSAGLTIGIPFLESYIKPDDAQKRADFVRLIVQIVGGAVVLSGAYFTWQRLELTQEGQVTDRFTKAIEQLGSEHLEIRLGGIYALERIARDSFRDHWAVMEVLTAYVRENAQANNKESKTSLAQAYLEPTNTNQAESEKPKPATDIQAILTVIGRRKAEHRHQEPQRLDLRGTDLCGADLSEAHLARADLSGAHLEEAVLWGAHLEGVSLSDAHLEGADLSGAHLEGADLSGAHLEGAFPIDTHLEQANLKDAHLEEAFLDTAHLEKANLSHAHLEGAVLTGAHLEEAFLWGIYLEGANLYQAHLEEANISEAHLEGANLRGAHLERATISDAHLEGADLRVGITDGCSQ